MSWRIQPISNQLQFTEEIKAFAKRFALEEALKQSVELQDVSDHSIESLGSKWRNHCLAVQQRILRRHNDKKQSIEYLDGLLVLAWRVNRFAHYYEVALVQKTLELSSKVPSEFERELATAKGCEKYHDCGILVAQHYTTIIGCQEILQGTSLTKFPDTGEILEALSLDCIMQAALCLPDNIEKALDLLADAASANNLVLQGALQLNNFYNRKAERASNGKAGALKRHEKMNELKVWTIQKYEAGTWKSANQAACNLMSEVLEQSQKIGANLTKSNAQRTIAEWIRKNLRSR